MSATAGTEGQQGAVFPKLRRCDSPAWREDEEIAVDVVLSSMHHLSSQLQSSIPGQAMRDLEEREKAVPTLLGENDAHTAAPKFPSLALQHVGLPVRYLVADATDKGLYLGAQEL